jgi:cytoskeleton protein RodZ
MKSTGQILQAARAARKLDIKEVARITKIRPQFLELLEADAFGQLPSATVAKGFIRNYSQFLGLNSEYVLAVFRRDFVENRAGQIVPRGIVDPVSQTSLWTPKSTVIAIVVFLFTCFFGYLAYQFSILIGPPSLSLSSPVENLQTADSTVEVLGKTDPEATISVNDKLVALDNGGQFFVRIPLVFGANTLTVRATNKSGKSASVTRHIFLTVTP